MVSPMRKDFSVIIRPDQALLRELEGLTAGLDASKLLHPPRREMSVSDALHFIETQLWQSLGADRGQFDVDCAGIRPGDDHGPGPVVEVQRNRGRDPAPPDVIAHVQLAFNEARDRIVTLLKDYRTAMATTGQWPDNKGR